MCVSLLAGILTVYSKNRFRRSTHPIPTTLHVFMERFQWVSIDGEIRRPFYCFHRFLWIVCITKSCEARGRFMISVALLPRLNFTVIPPVVLNGEKYILPSVWSVTLAWGDWIFHSWSIPRVCSNRFHAVLTHPPPNRRPFLEVIRLTVLFGASTVLYWNMP